MQIIRDWVRRILPNAQAISLTVLLVVGFVLVVTLADMLMPVFIAGVVAYLLEGLVAYGEREGLPRLAAVIVVFIAFMAFVLFILIAFLPPLSQQAVQLIQQLPSMINRAQELVVRLPEMYPKFITEQQINEIITVIRQRLIVTGQQLLTYSYASLVSFITLIVYALLVPLLVFFFLKDKELILSWFIQYLPKERRLPTRIWREVDAQIGNYIRGKFIEILILMGASYLTYSFMGLNYALLLSVLIGFSVVIPYIGATVVTFPVMLVAYFQFGLSEEFVYVVLAYLILQLLDGVVLATLLFSEVVNLHPIAIIVAILFFGGLWGFWGVFFAIPLATLVQAVLKAWPRADRIEKEEGGREEPQQLDDSRTKPPVYVPQQDKSSVSSADGR